MRRFLTPKIWSHGTPLGSLGQLLAKPLPPRFGHWLFLTPTMVQQHASIPLFMGDFLLVVYNWGLLCWDTFQKGKTKNVFASLFIEDSFHLSEAYQVTSRNVRGLTQGRSPFLQQMQNMLFKFSRIEEQYLGSTEKKKDL